MTHARTLLPASLALSLAACSGGPTTPRPVAAEILRAVLVVHLSDGSRCVALTPFTDGAGEFSNCPGLRWQISSDPRVNPLRRVIDDGVGLLAAESPLTPLALIEVQEADGRRTAFVSPPPGPLR